jgi:hypothetical protein
MNPRSLPPALNILFLALATIVYRAIETRWPSLLPNFSPMMALSIVSSVYLARQFGALVAPCVFLITEFFYLGWNSQSTGTIFSIWILLGPALYLILGWTGNVYMASGRNLVKFVLCSLVSSLAFYLVTNTVCWWGGMEYPQTFAGWIQANTTGIPGYPPTWLFLRNGSLGDLGFTLAFVAVLEPSLYARLRPATVQEQSWVGTR